jgi:aspartate carbamoyltransferase catalytic subunit
MPNKNYFYKQNFTEIKQIKSVEQLHYLFGLADKMKTRVEKKVIYEPLKGYCVAILFYQPSTRTFTSFVAAAKRLGAYIIDIQGMQEYSSVSKGESLPDTIKSIHQTTGADVVVLRHPENNSSAIAAESSSVPIINAGSGKLEHPTQALLDMYTIYSHFGRMDHLNVVMVGDLLYGRTTKSLAKLLALTNKSNKSKITFVSPNELKTPPELIRQLKKKIKVEETDQLNSHLKKADLIYMTRVQKEWFEKAGKMDEYERMKHQFILTRHMVSQMPKKSIVMHPLPRVGEILHEVDEDSRAKYFPQMRSGLYVRMALLASTLIK